MTIRELLQDQGGQFWGGFLGGLNQGMRQNQELQLKREHFDLQKKQLDAQIKLNENKLRRDMLTDKAIEAQAAGFEEPEKDAVFDWTKGDSVPGVTPQNRQRANAARIDPKAAAKSAFEPTDAEAMQRYGLQAAMLREAMNQQQAPQATQAPTGAPGPMSQINPGQPAPVMPGYLQPGPGGAPSPQANTRPGPQIIPQFGSRGRVTPKVLPPEREPQGADSARRKELVRMYGFDEGERRYQMSLRTSAENRGAGGEEGRLGVRQTPAYLQSKTDVAQAEAAGGPIPVGQAKEVGSLEGALRQLEIAEKNFSKDFIGPFIGTGIAQTVRRRAGDTLGVPLGTKESDFRGALARAEEQLIRAYEGQVISDPMYKRLKEMMPDTQTQNEQVFRSDMLRFKTELQKAMRTSKELINTPRSGVGQLGAGSGQGQGRLIPLGELP